MQAVCTEALAGVAGRVEESLIAWLCKLFRPSSPAVSARSLVHQLDTLSSAFMAATSAKSSKTASAARPKKGGASAIGAPAQRTQASRKGKRAWRKNIDIDAVEEGLEEIRAEERVVGCVPFFRASLKTQRLISACSALRYKKRQTRSCSKLTPRATPKASTACPTW